MTNLFKVDGQTLTPIEIYPAVSDTVNYLTFAFSFNSEWDGLTKSAIFTKGDDEYEVVLTSDAITADDHVNLSAGVWGISVVGDLVVDAVVTRQITTSSYNFNVTQSSATSGGVFPPSVASQVYINTNQATPQTFVGGIPKLTADRVIDLDNELADKKYVDDTVATVTADDFNHNDLANKQGGTTNEFYHVTAAEKTVIENTSGTNTGDQDVSGAISTHNTAADAHASLFAAITADIASRHALHYTFRWDKVNALGVRLKSLANIGTNITTYCHLGTLNTALSNPFDSIYPWSGRNVCNISIDAYRALTSGASLRDCIISWLGDPDFDYAHANGAYVYTPEFWYKVWDEGGYRYFDVSPIAITGYIHAPEVIEGRWHGGTYTLTIDGVSKSCLLPKPGMPDKNVAMSTLHTYAKNWGASVENIYGYSATDVLMIVEFATMNMQTAIGNGVSDLYRQGGYTIKANATASATVKILTADASTHCIPGAIFDIGATDGSSSVGSFIIASTALDADPAYTIVTLTTDGSTPASVTVTTAHFWSVHGLSNTVDASIGAGSGYIGTNGKSHAYYRGQVAHANLYRYIIGAYRQTGTGKIWIANNPAEADAYDALNTAVHKDTGFALPQGAAGAATEGYISALRLCPDVPAAPFCETVGGNSGNPIGDYCYVPTLATANTILIAGGLAVSGSVCGRFFGYWLYSAAVSSWLVGALPVLKSP